MGERNDKAVRRAAKGFGCGAVVSIASGRAIQSRVVSASGPGHLASVLAFRPSLLTQFEIRDSIRVYQDYLSAVGLGERG